MRNNMLGVEDVNGPINLEGMQTLTDVPPLHQEVPKSQYSIALMPKLVVMINSESDEEKIRATIGFRKLLSLDNNPPIQAVIDANLVPKFIEFLQRDDESRLQFEAAWALTNITSGTHEHTKMVEFMQHTSVNLQIPAIRTIGNIATGSDKQTQYVIDSAALPLIKLLLSHQKNAIRKEAAWTTSNVAAGTIDQIQELINLDQFPTLNRLINEDVYEVRKEAAQVISNATSSKNPDIVKKLVSLGCLEPMVNLLKKTDVRLLQIALDGLENILMTGQKMMTHSMQNPQSLMVDEIGGIDSLEELQGHPNQGIQDRVVTIMEKYFGLEDEEDAQGIPCPADIKDVQVMNNSEQYNKGYSFDFIPAQANKGNFNF